MANGLHSNFQIVEKNLIQALLLVFILERSIKSFSEDKEEKREDISHFTVGVITFMIHIMETALL